MQFIPTAYAYTWFNIDPSSTFQSSTMDAAGKLVTDLQPAWQTYLAVGLGLLIVVAIVSILVHLRR